MENKIYAQRYHDISCGHRVYGHENKCQYLHGHNYRIHFKIMAENLDSVGRVLDFGVIKSKLCMWLEHNFDHKFLIYEKDPLAVELKKLDPNGVVILSFNPTAENIAEYLLNVIGPELLKDTHCKLVEVIVEETRKCSATASL